MQNRQNFKQETQECMTESVADVFILKIRLYLVHNISQAQEKVSTSRLLSNWSLLLGLHK